MAKDTVKEPIDLDVMTGKGHITLNNITFEVEPIYVDEVFDFNQDQLPIPRTVNDDGTPVDDRKLSQFLISVFALPATEEEPVTTNSKGLFGKPQNQPVVTENKYAIGYRKWLEAKVKVGGEAIKLSDLDRVYHLSKSDIVRLIRFLYEFSGF